MAKPNSSDNKDLMGKGPDNEEQVSDVTQSKHETEVKSNETQRSNETEIPKEGREYFKAELKENDNREQLLREEVRTLNDSLKEKNSQIVSLETQLSQKSEAIKKLTLAEQKTREDLEEKNYQHKLGYLQGANDIGHEKSRVERRASEDKLREKEEELRAVKRRHDTEIRERERKAENKDRERAKGAVEETKQQRKLKNREKWRRLIILIGARNRRRIQKHELMKQVHEVLGQCEGFKLQLESASTALEDIQRQKEEEISQLQLELQRVQAEHIDTVAGLRGAVEETKQQRKLKNREKWRRLIILIGARNRRRIQKDELMKQVHEVLGQCEGFKLQLESASTALEDIERQKEEEISQLQLELQRVQAEHIDTVAGLRGAVEETKQQRKLKNREKWRRLIILIGARNRRRIQKDELMKQVHEVLGQCEGFKLQLESASTALEDIQRQKEEEISQLQLELQRVQAEHIDTVAGLRDQLDQSELRQTELHDQLTDSQHKLGYLRGANDIGQAWVQKMSEEAAQCRLNQEQMYNERILLVTKLERSQTEVKTLEENVQAMVVEKVDYAKKLEIVYMKNYNTEREEEELKATVELLREEVKTAESALRRAHQKDEEKSEELEKKNQEKRKLVNDIINLRRHLESTKSERERLRISCTHLRGELQQM